MLILEILKDIIFKMFMDTRIPEEVREQWFNELGMLYIDMIEVSSLEIKQ